MASGYGGRFVRRLTSYMHHLVLLIGARFLLSGYCLLNRHGETLVMADPVQLQQVILNLVVNAVEAMSRFGHEMRVLRLQTEVDHSAGMASVRVVDTGPRVEPEVVKKMFQPFFTTKSSGMGMGLSICKTIVEAHRGQLTASPNNPHGMEFQIVLPLYQHGANKQH
jgi:signal transduction histidine kinase